MEVGTVMETAVMAAADIRSIITSFIISRNDL